MTDETIHATCVAIHGRGVLLVGPSGCGKSDLALRLIDRGATLVSDDYTRCRQAGDRLIASPPATITGMIEVRGIGIMPVPHLAEAPVTLLIDLGGDVERMPEPSNRTIAGVALPMVCFAALEDSAPIKVELALSQVSK